MANYQTGGHHLPPLDYLEPESLTAACSLLSEYRGRAKLLAGGTDLVLNLKEGVIAPPYLVSLNRIPDLDDIDYDESGGLKIGARATHTSIATSPLVREKFPSLATACLKVGTPQVRNMGTIGGNISKAGPSQDTPPVLLTLDARIKLVSQEGERTVSVDDFFIAPFKTAMTETEILTEIQIPAPPPNSAADYRWLTKAAVADETLVGVAVLLALDSRKEICQDIRIGLCSVAPTAVRARKAEDALRGKRLEEGLFRKVAEIAASETSPRSRAEYRRRMTDVLTRRAITEVWHRSGGQ